MATIEDVRRELSKRTSGDRLDYDLPENDSVVYELVWTGKAWVVYSTMRHPPFSVDHLTLVEDEIDCPPFEGLAIRHGVTLYGGDLPSGAIIPPGASFYRIASPKSGLQPLEPMATK